MFTNNVKNLNPSNKRKNITRWICHVLFLEEAKGCHKEARVTQDVDLQIVKEDKYKVENGAMA